MLRSFAEKKIVDGKENHEKIAIFIYDEKGMNK